MPSPNPLPPMPPPTVPRLPFSSFKLISFDIFGTLIDDATSFLSSFARLTTSIPASSPYHARFKPGSGNHSVSTTPSTVPARESMALAAFVHGIEKGIEMNEPGMRHDRVLRQTYLTVAREWGIIVDGEVEREAEEFGRSIRSWKAFSDTVDACERLVGVGFKLVPLTNVDVATFREICEGGALKEVKFWRKFTAEEIGSYKPDLKNFEYLIKNVDEGDREEGGKGIGKEEILHVAHSLPADHVPAKEIGISSVWIMRGEDVGEGTRGGRLHEEGKVGYGWRFETLGELADAIEKEIREDGRGKGDL